MTLVLGFLEIYIYIVRKPIRHNPGVSLPMIISGHGFYGHPWLSRSERGPFSLAAREGLTLVLGIWELYIPYPGKKAYSWCVITSDYFRSWILWSSIAL